MCLETHASFERVSEGRHRLKLSYTHRKLVYLCAISLSSFNALSSEKACASVALRKLCVTFLLSSNLPDERLPKCATQRRRICSSCWSWNRLSFPGGFLSRTHSNAITKYKQTCCDPVIFLANFISFNVNPPDPICSSRGGLENVQRAYPHRKNITRI